MGEVYRARDTKLGRAVAIKVLPDAFQLDAERIARFEREARVLASLNHPNIGALFGMEESASRHFLVMELVEGETLEEKLRHEPSRGLPVAEALAIARQIAEALEAAHEKGIVHRDLKPANIKLTSAHDSDLAVKVLDFGLAKAMEADPAASKLTHSPTLSMATQAGVIMGTAAYMAPEQARGGPADRRADVWAFGAVLFEMLTGRQAFTGDTVSDILAAVLRADADWTLLPADTPQSIRTLLRRCLEKNARRRLHDIADARIEIDDALAAPAGDAQQTIVPPGPRRSLWRRAVPALAAATLAGALAAAAVWNLRPFAPLTVTRFSVPLPEGQDFAQVSRHVVAISPDGNHVAYVSNARLYVRSLSEFEARPVPGVQIANGGFPVFSPDSRWLLFYSAIDGALRKVALGGGAPITICEVGNVQGVSWGSAGIVFSQSAESAGRGIVLVSPNGGRPELLVSIRSTEDAFGPQMLPGGKSLLFTLSQTGTPPAERWEKAQIVVHSLISGERRTLIERGTDARYVPTGHIVYAVGGLLFAAPFDPGRQELKGAPVPVVEGVRRSATQASPTAQFGFSATGSLIYVPGPASSSSPGMDLGLIDRTGNIVSLGLPKGVYQHPRVAPDGQRIAFETDDGREAIIWIYDLSGTSPARRLTFNGKNRFATWSPDGQRVAFQSDREGDAAIFWQRADGTDGSGERLTKPDRGTSHAPESWARDGKTLLFSVSKDSTVSLAMFSLQDKRAAPFAGVQSLVPANAAFSPDGRWVAYNERAGNVGGVMFVQPFPATGAKYQIASNSAHHPVWSPDGKELFFVGPPNQFFATSVDTRSSFAVGNPKQLSTGSWRDTFGGPPSHRNYDIMPDGKRFIGVIAGEMSSGAPASQRIQVVLNWFEELKQRAPAGR